MSLGKRKKMILEGDVIFKYYYIDMGIARSYNKLQRWADEKYGINPVTGKSYTTGALWQAAWRWALKNLDEAKKIYENSQLDFGENVSYDEWKQLVAQHVKTCLSKSQRRAFFDANPEYILYEKL